MYTPSAHVVALKPERTVPRSCAAAGPISRRKVSTGTLQVDTSSAGEIPQIPPPHYTGRATAPCHLPPADFAAACLSPIGPEYAHYLTAANMLFFSAIVQTGRNVDTRWPQTNRSLLDCPVVYSIHPHTRRCPQARAHSAWHAAALPLDKHCTGRSRPAYLRSIRLASVRYPTDPPHRTGRATAPCHLLPAGSAATYRYPICPEYAHYLTAANMLSFSAIVQTGRNVDTPAPDKQPSAALPRYTLHAGQTLHRKVSPGTPQIDTSSLGEIPHRPAASHRQGHLT